MISAPLLDAIIDRPGRPTAEYQAVLDRAVALGYTLPSSGQQAKQNALVVALKLTGIWDLLDVYYVFATDGSSDFATLNWKNPSVFQATKVNSPTHASNQGFSSNGTTSYVDTNWNPSTNGVNFALNNSSFGVWSNTDSPLGGFSMGNQDGSGHRTQAIIYTDCFFFLNWAVTAQAYTLANTIGLFHIKRTSSTAVAAFRNGVSLGSGIANSTSRPNASIFICCRSVNGSPDTFSTKTISMAFAGASLNGLESSFYTAWNTYFSGL